MNYTNLLKDIRAKRKVCTEYYSRVFSSRVSIYISAFCISKGISANTITKLMFLFGLLSVGVFWVDSIIFKILSLWGMIIFNILDTVDGEIARYKNETSTEGIFYDRLFQYIVDLLLFASMAYYILIEYGIGIVFAFWLIFLFFFILDIFTKNLYELLSNRNPIGISYDRQSIIQRIAHATSSNTAIYHIYWILIVADYLFALLTGITHGYMQFIFII